MAEIKYILNAIDPESLIVADSLDTKQKELVNTFEVNSLFNPSVDRVRLDIYNLDDELLITNTNYLNYSIVQAGNTAGKEGSSEITIDPIQDAINNGFESGDIKAVYRFSNDIFSKENLRRYFFIESFSPDRTEVRLLTTELTDTQVQELGSSFVEKLNNTQDFVDFFLSFNNTETYSAINLAVEQIEKGTSIVIKTLEPLPTSISIDDKLTIDETVADAQGYEITTEYIESLETLSPLRGPNFDIDFKDLNNNPTEFFNYNELFSYPVTGSNYELYSLFNKKSVNIDVDHSDYTSFIHFSSAEERLKNFKYKLDLIKSYESSIDLINSTGYEQVSPSSSVDYYQGLIKGILRNFDHYDNFLYYQSGSYSWPKSNNTKPYENYASSHISASTWYNAQLVVANSYDNTNLDNLEGTVPTFIREDANNEPYMLFLNMIGQHFDNLWIYFKAVSDKYDADNRLDFGLSKDLVRDAIESFGINLYNSNSNIDNLLSMFVGETYNTGSEQVNTLYTILSGSVNSQLQPVSGDNYEKDVYKRIYHNLPLLVKGKGTSRGLRALISCFGIPENILQVRQFGGVEKSSTLYTDPFNYVTGSYDKIRINNSGSLVTGSTLSQYTSIENKYDKYSDDIHTVQVGFSISDFVDQYIKDNTTGTVNIDNYIGDPRERYTDSYRELEVLSETLPSGSTFYKDPHAFIRLIKYFDNSIFRIVRDFVPARSNIDSGVIIKPHVYNRSKAKQTQMSFTEEVYSGSTTTYIITGSHGESFSRNSSAAYTETVQTPLGKAPLSSHLQEETKFDGQFSGSFTIVSELDWNKANRIKQAEKEQILFDVTTFFATLPLPAGCNISVESEFIGELFIISSSVSGSGTVEVIYPSSVGPTSTGLEYAHNFDSFEFFTIEATAIYPNTFDGWYSGSSLSAGSLITASNTLTVEFNTEQVYGNNYYAKFI